MTIPTREAMARQLWLNYFNCILRQRGIITQEEYQKIARKSMAAPDSCHIPSSPALVCTVFSQITGRTEESTSVLPSLLCTAASL